MLDVISLFGYFLNSFVQFLFCLKQPNQAKQTNKKLKKTKQSINREVRKKNPTKKQAAQKNPTAKQKTKNQILFLQLLSVRGDVKSETIDDGGKVKPVSSKF